MSLDQHFQNTKDFLSDWSDFLALEPIRNYPHTTPQKIESWVSELRQKDLNELVDFENNFTLDTTNFEFTEFLAKLRSLISFPKFSPATKTELISKKIKKKKAHEVKQIMSLIQNIDHISLIDIGGGAGHLSENLIHQRDRFSYCIDQDPGLHESGKKRIQINSSENHKKIEFIPLLFDENAPHFKNSTHDKNMVFGLHACGDLSVDVLKYFEKSQSDYLLSVGCCYHKLTDKYNLSKLAKESGIAFTTNAFNLATRGYAYQSAEQLELKIKVRTYRYMLHCYLYQLGHKEFISIGQTKKMDYARPFSEYAHKYASKLIASPTSAQNFYDCPENQEMINKIIYTDIFRGLFGRVVETYLVLDRALYLQEKGYPVKIEEIFDRKLSPRNLAVSLCGS